MPPVIIDAAAGYGNQRDPGPTCSVFSLHATKPLAAGELVTLIYKARKGMSQGSNVTVRGVGPMSFKLRSGFQTVAGRLFQPGLTEAVVSKRIAERFQGLDIGADSPEEIAVSITAELIAKRRCVERELPHMKVVLRQGKSKPFTAEDAENAEKA